MTRGLNFEVRKKQIVALVGTSGSGKTTTALSIVRLLPQNIGVEAGEIIFGQQNLLLLDEEEMRSLRGGEISMVFQEPLSAFNPVYTIGSQINEMLIYHTSLSRRQRRDKILELLDLVGIPEPRRIVSSYPHQLSGGLRQRAMIAQAIAAQPKLLIADEPTSNLDVTLQARIIDLFKTLNRQLDMAILLITHDLGVVKHLADYAAILYHGRIVDFGKVNALFNAPQHPFTQQLVEVLQV